MNFQHEFPFHIFSDSLHFFHFLSFLLLQTINRIEKLYGGDNALDLFPLEICMLQKSVLFVAPFFFEQKKTVYPRKFCNGIFEKNVCVKILLKRRRDQSTEQKARKTILWRIKWMKQREYLSFNLLSLSLYLSLFIKNFCVNENFTFLFFYRKTKMNTI